MHRASPPPPAGHKGPSRRALLVGLVLLAALARVPGLDAPLLDGAAGKQAHTAMVARNLLRGRGSFLLPVVDDVGRPGYFVKEAPLVPAASALIHDLTGVPLAACGRALSALLWLAGAPVLAGLLNGAGLAALVPVATGFYLFSPLALAYSVSFQNDAAAVLASLVALGLAGAWARRPAPGAAAAAGLAAGLALLLKPHVVLWLGPALILLGWPSDGPTEGGPSRRQSLGLAAFLGLATLPALAWYAHAFQIHARFPVAGAMVAAGWVEPGLWLRPELYLELARQTFWMVLTPAGALLCGFGMVGARRPGDWREPAALPSSSDLAEARRHGAGGDGRVLGAFLVWSAGVLGQSFLFATRAFDELARGTEYYQLALVPGLAPFVALGWLHLRTVLAPHRVVVRGLVAGLVLVAFAGATVAATIAARTPQARYARLTELCAEVRKRLPAHLELLVLADRAGTVLYECDRRGTALVPAGAVHQSFATRAHAVPAASMNRLLGSVDAVLLPFPELLPPGDPLRDHLDVNWRHENLGASSGLLFRAR